METLSLSMAIIIPPTSILTFAELEKARARINTVTKKDVTRVELWKI